MGAYLKYQFPFAKYPAIRIALLFAAGIVLAVYTSASLTVWMVLLAAVTMAGVICDVLNRTRPTVVYSRLAVIFYLAGVMLFGAGWQTLLSPSQKPPSATLLSSFTWEKVIFQGTVSQIDPSSSGNLMLDTRISQTIIRDSLYWEEPFKMRAYWEPQPTVTIEPGDEIKFIATIYPLEPVSNPGQFKYKRYLASQNIFIHAGINRILAVSKKKNRFSWNWLQKNVRQLIELNFNEDTEALANSLLIGYKNELDQKTKTAFSRVGLAHIMAVSGMNVVYILAPFWFFIPFLWTVRFGKQLALGLMIFILVLFAGLTGFSASVMRACIVGGFITYGRIFNKARSSKNLTAVAAIIILLINPGNLFNVGFQLSFTAVYIILLVLPVIKRLIPDAIQYRWYGIPVMAAIVTLVVQLGLYPILSFYFHEFSLIAPLANAIIVPFLGLVVPYALFLLFISAILPSVGFWLNAPCRWFLNFLQWFTATLSQWSWSWLQTPETGLLLFIIWLAALLFLASVRIPRLRWKILTVLLAILTIQQGFKAYQALQPAKLKITIFDVGQGDAALVSTPAGRHFLIDTGRWSPDYNSGSAIILPYLKTAGIRKLDAVILSHPHADHIGGMAALIGHIPITVIYNSGITYGSDLYKRYLKKANSFNIPVKSLQAGDMIPLGMAVKIFVYGPSPYNHSSDVNEHSLVLELIYGQTQFLFMGDAGKYQEELLIQNYRRLIDTDFLKAGHHGSKTSSTLAFLHTATPEISVISVAKTNRYGLPDARAIRRLRKSGAKLRFTALTGALQFISNGKTIKRIKWQ